MKSIKKKILLSKINKDNKKILHNSFWLFFDTIFRTLLSLIVMIWMTRYLGAEQIGLLNYAQAFTVLFSAIASLGLDNIIIRDMIRNPEKKENLLGTAFFLKILGSIFTIIISYCAILIMKPNDDLIHLLVIIISLSSLFKSVYVIDILFQSQVNSKWTVLAQGIASIIISLLKVIFIWIKAPLIYFAVTLTLETIFVGIGLIFFLFKNGESIFKWKLNVNLAKYLLGESWPLIITTLGVALYMRIDQIMIGQIIGPYELGIYSVGIKLTEFWYFIPLALANSIFPSVVYLKDSNYNLYMLKLQKFYTVLTWGSIIIAIIVSVFADFIIVLLFGKTFAAASNILTISIWTSVFVFQGTARSKWIINEGLQKYIHWFTIVGLLINVVLNYFLIPIYSIKGAAIASLISQMIIVIIIPLFVKPTRVSSLMLIKAFVFDGFLKKYPTEINLRNNK
ncbi:flippase [Priestia megaterium]|uniref:flippase n=1 Tax=Priestia megaterium TaxID=1404 RepID=UPI000BF4D924|nr:flippase [Priestia megaterium]PFD99359.1 O-unit flippase [Priestia megaterium]